MFMGVFVFMFMGVFALSARFDAHFGDEKFWFKRLLLIAIHVEKSLLVQSNRQSPQNASPDFRSRRQFTRLSQRIQSRLMPSFPRRAVPTNCFRFHFIESLLNRSNCVSAYHVKFILQDLLNPMLYQI